MKGVISGNVAANDLDAGGRWLRLADSLFIPAKKGSIFALILAQFVFVCWCGEQERRRPNWRKMAVRWAYQPRQWFLAGCGAGIAGLYDAIRRISTHPLWRWLLHMQMPLFRCGCCTPARLTISH